ncbi:hypothetical protein [Sphingomonas lenta]|uniref:Uncharacterized protein n=1 Tax=Sphingomonas lenta TaxID=1141887 RepID=A0A2A2SII2_9SPHN|nr:hypothetical protein [Sphingomonas lenta]PAX09087.1 hypothetical protein CKY28_07110 [Sphingomonas lenta]
MSHRRYGGRSNPFLHECPSKAGSKRLRIDAERLILSSIVLVTFVLIILLDTVGEEYVWLLLEHVSKL